MASDGKTDRRVTRTRKAIMSAFNKLISINGIDKITVSAIAREADIDRKTFYLHYGSISELANRHTEQELERILRTLKEEGEGKAPLERVHIALAEVNAIITENIDLYKNIASSLSINQILDCFEQAISPAMAHENIESPYIDDTVVRMRLQFYIAGALSLYSTWLASDRSTPIETISDTIESAIKSSVFPTVALSAA